MNPAEMAGPILIVEDDRNTANLVATYLQREGFRTREVHDGAQALAAARREPPGFVILDVMLPGMDGWEICRELRKVSDVPILMLTAREEEIDRVLGLSLGADDYVVKPFSPRELVERVKAILRRARPAPQSHPTPQPGGFNARPRPAQGDGGRSADKPDRRRIQAALRPDAGSGTGFEPRGTARPPL